jgi:hypothetical protein
MLQIIPYPEKVSYRKIKHGPNVFHDALKGVLQGEKFFQVINPNGDNYGLHYVANIDWAKKSDMYDKSEHLENYPLYPPYLSYDEEDTSKFSFDIFHNIKKVWFKEANEYTIVVAGIILKHTDMAVSFADERITMFIPESDRLKVSFDEPDTTDKTLLRVIDSFYPTPAFKDNNQVDQIFCFHHIFFFQGLTDLPLDKIKYAELVIVKDEGIGSILSCYHLLQKYFKTYGITLGIQPGSSRYPDEMLEKYFDLRISTPDFNEDNTVLIVNYFAAWFVRMAGKDRDSQYNINSLNPTFKKEMDEYAQAVMGSKRMLAVLLRGTDFITSGMAALAKPVTADFAIPLIKQWMEEDSYDGIVLATEDEDMLSATREASGNKLIAISQERFSVEKLGSNETIAQLEQNSLSGEKYHNHIVDITVNYFYAVYLLSKCESFIYSNLCGGERLTHIFNDGKYKKELCLSELAMQNSQ